jgi:D-alanyl-D-alanine carboxypeptidase
MRSRLEGLFGILTLAALFLVGHVFFSDFLPHPQGLYEPPAITVNGPFYGISILAESAYVLDLATFEVLYEKEGEAQMPLASLTKLMTALVAHEMLPESARVPITAEALREEGDSGFHENETYDAPSLLDFTLLTSSNDGAAALAAAAGAALSGPDDARAAFIAKMNETARRLGLSQTFFINPTGLDLSTTTAGSYGSARDVALLVAELSREYPHLLEATRAPAENLAPGEARNTNTRTGDFPGLLFSKTGFTDLAGGNLAIAFDAGPGHPVVVVVLGSTREGRFDDASALAEAARRRIAQRTW